MLVTSPARHFQRVMPAHGHRNAGAPPTPPLPTAARNPNPLSSPRPPAAPSLWLLAKIAEFLFSGKQVLPVSPFSSPL